MANAAQKLFMEKRIAVTSMDEIVKTFGYSKVTVYVYFQNKSEIVSIFSFRIESMRKLRLILTTITFCPFVRKTIYRVVNILLLKNKSPIYTSSMT